MAITAESVTAGLDAINNVVKSKGISLGQEISFSPENIRFFEEIISVAILYDLSPTFLTNLGYGFGHEETFQSIYQLKERTYRFYVNELMARRLEDILDLVRTSGDVLEIERALNLIIRRPQLVGELLSEQLHRRFPDVDFKGENPAGQIRKSLSASER